MATSKSKTSTSTAAKPAVKAVAKKPVARAKTPAQVAASPAARARKIAKPAAVEVAPAVAAKVKKANPVRAAFNMDESEYALLTQMKKSLLSSGLVKRGQLLRAGITLLREASPERVRAIVAALPQLKPASAKNKA